MFPRKSHFVRCGAGHAHGTSAALVTPHRAGWLLALEGRMPRRWVTRWVVWGFFDGTLRAPSPRSAAARRAGRTLRCRTEIISSTSAYTSLRRKAARDRIRDEPGDSTTATCEGWELFDPPRRRRSSRHAERQHSERAARFAQRRNPPLRRRLSRLGPQGRVARARFEIGKVDPYALIFRYFVQTGDDGSEDNWLIVARVENNNACIIDTVSGKLPTTTRRLARSPTRTARCTAIRNAGS